MAKLKKISMELVNEILSNNEFGIETYSSGSDPGCGCGCGYDYGCGCGCGCGSGYGCGSGSGSGCGSGCGSGSGSGSGDNDDLVITNRPYKGIRFSDDIMANPELSRSLTKALRCDTLQTILAPFVKGDKQITITLSKFTGNDADSAMYTDARPNATEIAINSTYVDNSGFAKKTTDTDNAGYTHHNNVDETFIVSFAHEALHAKHYNIYFDVRKKYNNDIYAQVHSLLEQGYSRAFVEIFYKEELGVWKDVPLGDFEERDHAYMKKYDGGVFTRAASEYK